jgi:hypothetical protein
MKILKAIFLGLAAAMMLGTTGCVIHEHRGYGEIHEHEWHHGYYHEEPGVDVHLHGP